MKKMLMDDDTVLIDGKEFTKEELKKALMDQVRYHRLSDFIQTTFKDGGVTSEH